MDGNHTDSNDKISAIAEIISDNDGSEEIINEFVKFSLNNHKDLGAPSSMQAYDENFVERFKLAKSLYEQGNYVRSKEVCEKLYAQQPHNVNIILLWSATFYMQGQYDQSLECLHKIPDKYRECTSVLNNLAANHFKQKHIKAACREYQSALKKNVGFVECWLGFIMTLVKFNDYVNAVDALNWVIFFENDKVELHLLCGQLLIKMNKFDEARTKFQAAIQLDPESHASWTGLGDVFAYKEQFHSAIVCYEKALEINESSMETLINLGFMFYQVKQFNKSIAILKTAIQKYPMKNTDLLPTLANAYLHNGDSSLAETYSMYLQDKSQTPDIVFDMGLKYLTHLDNETAAEQCFKLCVDLDERCILFNQYLLIAYLKLDKKELAFKTCINWAKAYMFEKHTIGMMIALNTGSKLLIDNDHSDWKLGRMLKLDIDTLLKYADARKLKPEFFLNFSNIAYV